MLLAMINLEMLMEIALLLWVILEKQSMEMEQISLPLD